jgi:hypothetical protein
VREAGALAPGDGAGDAGAVDGGDAGCAAGVCAYATAAPQLSNAAMTVDFTMWDFIMCRLLAKRRTGG